MIALLAALAVAMTPPISCPLHLEDGAIAFVKPPAGWHGMAHDRMRLSSGGVLGGPPDEGGYLVPTSRTGTKQRGTTTWAFAAGQERWLWCGYGGSGDVQIAKRLPDSAGDCIATYRMDASGSLESLSASCVLKPRD